MTDSTDSYVPVATTSLRVNAQLPFDLYLRTEFSGDHTLFREGRGLFTQADHDQALAQNLDSFYVPEEQRDQLYSYCRDRVSEVIDDESISVEEKAQVVYGSGAAIVQDVFAHPNSGPRIDQAKSVIQDTVRFIVGDEEATQSMIFMTHHDYYTYTHSMNVAIFGVALAQRIFGADSPEHDLTRLGEGFLLHDIGKSRIATEIIQSPQALTPEQEAEMRRHPQLGYRVLAEVGRLDEVAMPIILEHHERLDGTGYPAGLEGDEIHIYARICAIVDVFDALTTTRPYRKGMKTFEALRLMRETMANELQPEFLAEFVKIFAH